MEMWELKLKGASLPADVQKAVYSENFKRLTPHRVLDAAGASEYIRAILKNDKLRLSDEEKQTIEALI
jgi:hypothetical protein